jgi:hypothetical protein
MGRQGIDPKELRAELRAAGVKGEVVAMTVLRKCYDLEFGAIAQRTGIKPDAVRAAVERASRRLLHYREQLAAANETEPTEPGGVSEAEALSLDEEAEALLECVRGKRNLRQVTPLVPEIGLRDTLRTPIVTKADVREILRRAKRRRGED